MSRQRWARASAHALQRLRLEQIACGRAEPLCNREEFYLRTLRDHGRANPADFIIPYPMLLIEASTELDDPQPDQPFTPTLEPAISAP
jgi:hypothetical protein